MSKEKNLEMCGFVISVIIVGEIYPFPLPPPHPIEDHNAMVVKKIGKLNKNSLKVYKYTLIKL